MPASIGVNLRVTGHCRQGGRKYMEDFFSVAYQQTEDERDLEYAFFGIYDGHGGAEAAAFAKERLMENIVRHKFFWSDNDEEVLRAIKLGYIATHYAMWKEQEKWPKTASGLPSTAGTTASVAFIRKGKIYIGHVGDSAIVLGYQEPGCSAWKAKPLTRDHKPESASEMLRIEQSGGKVVSKSGVPRVVWNRPRIGHKGPVRRSTPIDEIPFLAVARSLGDLWSYNSELDEFVVSPDPDCSVIPIDTATFRCLIFGTDGLYNMLNPQMAVHIVQQAEKHNEEATLCDALSKIWVNPSKCLVERALKLWSTTKMRADNTSVVTLMLDPPGPPRAQVLRNRKKAYPDSGLQILTRFENGPQLPYKPKSQTSARTANTMLSYHPQFLKPITSYRTPAPLVEEYRRSFHEASDMFTVNYRKEKPNVLRPRSSLSFDPNSPAHTPKPTETIEKEVNDPASHLEDNETEETSAESKEEPCTDCKKDSTNDTVISNSEICSNTTPQSDSSEENIQINEISSSSNELEDEEVASLRPKNFTKINFRRSKSRSSIRRIAKNSEKLEVNGRQGRKRCSSEPSESNICKRARSSATNSEMEAIKHDLRMRKVSTIENVMKKNEEMVNQVDSTNKELRQKLGPMRKCKTERQINLKAVHSNIVKARQTRFNLRKTIRKSQRLKSKPGLGKNHLQTFNKSPSKCRILKKSAPLSSNRLSNNSVKNQKSKQVLVTSSSIARTKSDRTFKIGYISKLRRRTATGSQTK
ncbi:hypothetical protein Trydic_g9239 [Trypoxylus dichotomus]